MTLEIASDHTKAGTIASEEEKIVLDYHARIRNDIFPLVPRHRGTLLDLGGGIGATAARLKNMGYAERAGVIDLVHSKAAASGLDFHYAANLEEYGTIEDVAAREGPFSTILCLDVLEHLRDPWSVISRLHKTLASGGVIVASIPNIRHYTATVPLVFQGKWDLLDNGVRDRTHLRWFVRDTAVSLMTSSGLKLDEVRGNPSAGRRIQLFRAMTFGLFNDFTNLQYLVRVRNPL